MKRIVDHIVQVEEELKALRQTMEIRFESMEKRFEARFESTEKRFEARFEAINARFESIEKRFTILQWFMGIGFTIISILIAVFGLFVGKA